MELGKPKNSVDIMTAALKAHSGDPLVLEFLGEAYLADGQFINAEKIFSLLLDNNQKKDLFYINLARAQMGMGENKLAEENFKMAAQGESLTAYSNYMLGVLYEDRKDWKNAALHLERAVNYDNQFIEARLHYATALEKLKDYNEAWRQYRIVYSAEKNNSAAEKGAQRMAPKLTKTKKEIMPPKELAGHTFVKQVISTDGQLPVLKVGLGAKGDGSPAIRNSITFIPSHDFRIVNTKTNALVANGKAKETWRAEIKDGKTYVVSPKNKRTLFSGSVTIKQNATIEAGQTTILKKIMTGAGMTWASEDDKEFRGDIEILYNTQLKTLIPINHVNIEEYVFGVIASEMPTNFPLDALRAQAILARTYALKQRGRHKKWGYDVCDTQHCQVYGGVPAETEKGNAAVESTMGQALTYNGKPIEAVFSSNCGGFTQSSKSAGWFDHPYLVSRTDYRDIELDNLQIYQFKELLQHPQDAYGKYDRHVSKAAFRWVRVVDAKELREIVKKQRKDIGEIVSIIPIDRHESGYVSQVKIVGKTGSIVLNKENTIKRYLSLGMLRSAYFIVQPVYIKKELKEFVFFGGGWGHGVGFCQTGSAGRAEAGQSYDDIILHYYPGTKLQDIRTK
ncbi:SpoIID/LytB domain protein [Elusimicrobium simillimum]